MEPIWSLGLMSGTSADGIDAALIKTDGCSISEFGPCAYFPYSDALSREIIQSYGRPPVDDKLGRIITEQHALAVKAFLAETKIKPELIGFHGQTVFHIPPQANQHGETYQIGDGLELADLTGISVIDRFRQNDMAHGGYGAPLVPLFHQALCQALPKPIAIINIGGVANVTWIGSNDEQVLAFDTGAGNGLMNDFIFKRLGIHYDEDGRVSAAGVCDDTLLTKWMQGEYFQQRPPKSLDRQYFLRCLEDLGDLTPADGMATLAEFTAVSISKASDYFPEAPKLWVVAGGGAHNPTLIQRLRHHLGVPVKLASDLGFDSDALEAQAFGFLAVRSLRGLSLSLPSTTAVSKPLTGGRLTAITLSP